MMTLLEIHGDVMGNEVMESVLRRAREIECRGMDAQAIIVALCEEIGALRARVAKLEKKNDG